MTFDRTVPIQDQISRRIKTKTGRKHRHAKGPGRVAAEKRAKAMQACKVKQAKRGRYLKRVRAYWAGEIDEHP
jgi:hypothetical protein